MVTRSFNRPVGSDAGGLPERLDDTSHQWVSLESFSEAVFLSQHP